MSFKIFGQNHTPSIQPASGAKTAPVEKPASPAPNLQSKDQIKTHDLPIGQGLSHISLSEGSDPLLEVRLKKIEHLLATSKKPSLSLPQKEQVIRLLKESQADGNLPELAKRLNSEDKLVPLYHKMGSLLNRSPEASTLLGLVTLGLSLGEEAKTNRAFEMKEILTNAGVSPEILKKLHD
ncbi:hypothetical protein COW36_05780 [bacterium (Candidatus Blackallbacteria) CG17_big_fil_post_rev_8_21_14_2_50_48_46]|uniref:Uncharacterized protein n=1 Tax=bacterium (Candidatus Blackallbacteria) CG17_big_fil_post_rev_8_21_14_2_50_48_46 TaxID=2014261 RepID=A0A2M7G863_9BACT|nr:MAG: hypothetical protein COW64_21375 [bacterium (Candidatus Blackallbacteria) CG18_big_fil_WC_8_21_14_2_50_49_26]PIW18277.1 MAG: hypothetical protein COW36_05780 [bacterium (Candidatus Blackallbacteria) CG17_big_fil_post_rev_8_21_14_2_50_48_46]PIW49501.1 MAG: hypothetical protein COW20_05595 [bacterium (Candidatus Blackallbacteria) CG13_big_fil_rev_8_21_14_2_50_49_14]